MTDKLFALLTILISNFAVVVVALTSHRMAIEREQRAFLRTLRKERVDAIRRAGEACMAALLKTSARFSIQKYEHSSELTDVLASALLWLPQEVVQSATSAAEALLQWERAAAKGELQAEHLASAASAIQRAGESIKAELERVDREMFALPV